jgi:hypothetical protein
MATVAEIGHCIQRMAGPDPRNRSTRVAKNLRFVERPVNEVDGFPAFIVNGPE